MLGTKWTHGFWVYTVWGYWFAHSVIPCLDPMHALPSLSGAKITPVRWALALNPGDSVQDMGMA